MNIRPVTGSVVAIYCNTIRLQPDTEHRCTVFVFF